MHDSHVCRAEPETILPVNPSQTNLIDISPLLNTHLRQTLASFFRKSIDRFFMIPEFNTLYKKLADMDAPAFFEKSLEALDIKYRIDPADLKRIPTNGPLVIIGNHPFGGLEGIIAGDILARRRPDVKILGNYLLQQIAPIRDCVIPVDPFGTQTSTRNNIRGLRKALQWLKSGGTLIAFPAGEVAHMNLRIGRVADPVWSDHISSLIRKTDAKVMPLYFPGKNSRCFQCLGMIHPRLRTAMLPREVLNKRGKTIKMYTGNAISRKQLEPFKTDRDATRYLRSKTCFLKNRARKPDHRFFSFAFRKSENRTVEPVIAPVSPTLLSSDIAGLPAENRLVSQKYMTAYYARAFQIPNILKEIGRLREITFRSAQEGTGRFSDIDRFDQSYVHLFLWNEKKSEIVGAYRMGLTDELLARQGKRGLYSHTLFRYKPEFLQRIGSSIEMGRSFIRLEYQRKYSSLLLLWQGIGQFILKHPKYSLLFGPVSISRNYHVISKSLMVQFLIQNRFDPKLSGFVSPRKPYRVEKIKGVNPSFIKTHLKNYNDVSVMVSEIEKDGKGLPVLLQHYLKLNARLVGFNVDNNFSDVVDGLILVDLKQTEPRLIRRFMGDEGVRLFEMDKTV